MIMLGAYRAGLITALSLFTAAGCWLLASSPSGAAELVATIGQPIVAGPIRVTITALRDATPGDKISRPGQRVLILEGTAQNVGTSLNKGHYTSVLFDAKGVAIPEKPPAAEAWSLPANKTARILASFYLPHGFIPTKIVLSPHGGAGSMPVTVTMSKR